jgi:ketosteroid isomerase-like protein
MMSGPESVEGRLRILEDERGILRTLYQYAHSLDYGHEEDFLDCWTETAVWEAVFEAFRREVSGRPRRETGRDEIAAFYRKHTHAPSRFHKHLLIEPQISVHGDEARVESYFVRIDEHPDGPYIQAFGRYQDVLVRCGDGRWRLQLRHAEGEDYLDKLAGTAAEK